MAIKETFKVRIDLTKIPPEFVDLYTNPQTGEESAFVTICLSAMKKMDKAHNTHTAYVYQEREQAQASGKVYYIGKGRRIYFAESDPMGQYEKEKDDNKAPF